MEDEDTPPPGTGQPHRGQTDREHTDRERRRRVLLRSAAVLGALGLFYAALIPFAGYLEAAGHVLAETVGLWGVFLYVFVVDAFIIPTTIDVVLPFVLEWPVVLTLGVISGGSILGGMLGYMIGRKLKHLRFVKRATEPYRRHGTRLIELYGTGAVALAALLPLPFSTVSWIAGMLGIQSRHYLLAALLRIPRIVAAYYAMQAGMFFFG